MSSTLQYFFICFLVLLHFQGKHQGFSWIEIQILEGFCKISCNSLLFKIYFSYHHYHKRDKRNLYHLSFKFFCIVFFFLISFKAYRIATIEKTSKFLSCKNIFSELFLSFNKHAISIIQQLCSEKLKYFLLWFDLMKWTLSWGKIKYQVSISKNYFRFQGACVHDRASY